MRVHRPGSSISQRQERADRALQFANLTETAVTQVQRDIAKEAFNHVHPRTGGWGEMHVEAFVLLKPRPHVGCLCMA